MRSIIVPIVLWVALITISLYPVIQPAEAVWTSNDLQFSGFAWQIKTGEHGPGNNVWGSRTSTDASGALHLTVTKQNNRWSSSEIRLPRSLGYGTYQVTVASQIDRIDPNLVFGLFIYKDDAHEFNMEFSNWKSQTWKNTYYTVQPFYLRNTNQRRYRTDLLSSAPTTLTMIWSPSGITFRLTQNNITINEFTYVGRNNFQPNHEQLHLSFWQYEGAAPSDEKNHEFIVQKFTFTPLTQ